MIFSLLFNNFKEGMEDFGRSLAIIINSVLLTFVYFFGVGITSLIAKIVGKKFLDNKIISESKSYWVDLDLTKKGMEEYYRQF